MSPTRSASVAGLSAALVVASALAVGCSPALPSTRPGSSGTPTIAAEPTATVEPTPTAEPTVRSGVLFEVSGEQAAIVDLIIRFVTAFNAADLTAAEGLLKGDASVSDCDYASEGLVTASTPAAIRTWLRARFADHDHLVIGRIFNMNPDSDRAVGVDFANRTSEAIIRAGAPSGIVPQVSAKVVVDPTGMRIAAFANGPGGAAPADVRRLCSVLKP